MANIWAKKPLDYSPGTRWQYSNTGYIIAGLIIQIRLASSGTAAGSRHQLRTLPHEL